MNSFQKMKYLHRNKERKAASVRSGRKEKRNDRAADTGKNIQRQDERDS